MPIKGTRTWLVQFGLRRFADLGLAAVDQICASLAGSPDQFRDDEIVQLFGKEGLFDD